MWLGCYHCPLPEQLLMPACSLLLQTTQHLEAQVGPLTSSQQVAVSVAMKGAMPLLAPEPGVLSVAVDEVGGHGLAVPRLSCAHA